MSARRTASGRRSRRPAARRSPGPPGRGGSAAAGWLRAVEEHGDEQEQDPQPQRVADQQRAPGSVPVDVAAIEDRAQDRPDARCPADREHRAQPERGREPGPAADDAAPGPPADTGPAGRRGASPPVLVARLAEAPASSGRQARSSTGIFSSPVMLSPSTISRIPPICRRSVIQRDSPAAANVAVTPRIVNTSPNPRTYAAAWRTAVQRLAGTPFAATRRPPRSAARRTRARAAARTATRS